MPDLWVPGVAGGPPPSVDEFLARVHDQIQGFRDTCGCEQVTVEVLLHDGTSLQLASMAPEPGYGWVTLNPVPEDADGPEGPRVVLVPLGSVVRIVVEVAERPTRVGFSLPEAGA
jgi:hypothetical protein